MHQVNSSDQNNQDYQNNQGYHSNQGHQGNYSHQGYQSNYGNQGPPIDNKKIAAGLLGIFLGPWGVHKFYLGYTTEGIVQILVTLFSCGMLGILGVIEGIVYLTKSDEEFYRTYQLNKKGWF